MHRRGTLRRTDVRGPAWNQAKGRTIPKSAGRRGRTTGDSRKIARSRYALWKNPTDLNTRQHHQLEWIAKTDPRLWRAYLLKEGLRYVFATKGTEGKDALTRWLSWARRSQPLIALAMLALGSHPPQLPGRT